MNLLTYAVSQHLHQQSDLWRYVSAKQDIPPHVVAQAFQETLARLQDDQAECLTTNYQQYLKTYIPLTFQSDSPGFQVQGQVSDEALDVLETLHHKDKEAVVEETVRLVMGAINPGHTVEVSDIQCLASACQHLQDQAQKTQATLQTLMDEEAATTSVPSATVLTELPEEELPEATVLPEPELSEEDPELQAMVSELTDRIQPTSPVEPTLPADTKETTHPETPSATEDAPSATEDAQSVADKNVVAGAWNHFMQSLVDSGLADQLEFQTPLMYAHV